jgi:hypothetical protein
LAKESFPSQNIRIKCYAIARVPYTPMRRQSGAARGMDECFEAMGKMSAREFTEEVGMTACMS